MRILLVILAFTSFCSLQAQTHASFNSVNYMQPGAYTHSNLLNDSNNLNRKWSVSAYGGMGAGVGFFNGGNTAFFPAQIGLQLNRRLSNNLYAFTGVYAAPAFFNFNRSFSNTDPSKNYMTAPRFNQHGFGLYSGIQAGLMYVNDDKTFSISGSIGISNSSFPVYQPARINTQKQPLPGSRQ